jgi:hypothetical protein
VRRTLFLVVAVWLVAAIGIGASGVLGRLPVPPPGIALLLTVALLLTLRLSSSVRHAVYGVGPAPLVAVHLARIAAGAYFLVLYRRGVLPAEFAVPAGWGDILVGIGAGVVLITCVPLRTQRQRFTLRLWNALGLVDILMVLGNGVRLFVREPSVGVPFTLLPLALLPTMLVPVVIVTHLLLFAWSWPSRPDTRS